MLRTGDVYRERGMTITIGDISPDGRWAMIHCVVYRERYKPESGIYNEWTKQQPVTEGCAPDAWELVQRGPEPAQERTPEPDGALRAWTHPAWQNTSAPGSTSPQS